MTEGHTPAGRVVVVSGCPGSGKSTLAAGLAARFENGIHLATDAFFRFPAHRLDPSTTQAAAQNAIVQRAWLASALSFRNDGCDVIIDGVFPVAARTLIQAELGPCGSLWLHASLDTVLDRCANRKEQASAHPDLVRRMHAQFESESDLSGTSDEHSLDTTHLTSAQVLDLTIERLGLPPLATA